MERRAEQRQVDLWPVGDFERPRDDVPGHTDDRHPHVRSCETQPSIKRVARAEVLSRELLVDHRHQWRVASIPVVEEASGPERRTKG